MFDKDRIIITSGFSGDETDSPEFLPLFSQEDEDEINKEKSPDELPILPLRNTVMFPGVVFPITVGRDKSIKLIKDANAGKKEIGVVAQLDAATEDPEFEELYKTGTLAHILKVLRMPDGNTTVIIQGKKRIAVGELLSNEPYIRARVSPLEIHKAKKDKQSEALIDSIKELALRIIELSPNIHTEASFEL